MLETAGHREPIFAPLRAADDRRCEDSCRIYSAAIPVREQKSRAQLSAMGATSAFLSAPRLPLSPRRSVPSATARCGVAELVCRSSRWARVFILKMQRSKKCLY